MNLLGLDWSGWGQGPMAGSWKMVMNLLIPSNVVNFLTSRTAINFCRGTLLAGVVCVSCRELSVEFWCRLWKVLSGLKAVGHCCFMSIINEFSSSCIDYPEVLHGFASLSALKCHLQIGRNHNLYLPTLWSSTAWKLVKSEWHYML